MTHTMPTPAANQTNPTHPGDTGAWRRIMTGTRQTGLAAGPGHELLVMHLPAGRRQAAGLPALTALPVDQAGTMHNRIPPVRHARGCQSVSWPAAWAAAAAQGCRVTRLRQPQLPLRKLAGSAAAPDAADPLFNRSRRSCRRPARTGPTS